MEDYINSAEGEKVFEELCEPKNEQMFRDRKKWFVDPPPNVRRWITIYKSLEFKLLSIKLKTRNKS